MNSLEDIGKFREVIKLDILAQQVVEGFITGLHKSPFHGFSVEFAEHRIYNKGESTKHIDWKLYARTERLYVKRYEEETNLRSQLIIDSSSSMLFPYHENLNSKLAYSIFCSAALVHLLRKQRDAAGITLVSDKINLHTPSKLSSAHVQMIFGELENLLQNPPQLNEKTSLSKHLHELADTVHKRSLMIIFSDFIQNEPLDDLFSALQHLRHNKHEVILFHVYDSVLEKEFHFENRPHRFIDLETGEKLELNPGSIRDAYLKNQQEFMNQLKVNASKYAVDLVEADIREDFSKVLSAYLLKRKKLF